MGWDQIIGAAIDGGAVMVLAVVTIYFNQRGTRDMVERAAAWADACKACRLEERTDKLTIIDVVKENTEANIALREAVKEMGHREMRR